MTYHETLKYLDSFINYEEILPPSYKGTFKLERMRRLLEILEEPHRSLKTIHVAGTKGKGSTALLISSILKEAGLRVGLYTSPHLISFRERIRFDGRMIEEDELCRITSSIRPQLEEMRPEGISFFEVYTAIAFLYFKEKRADLSVIETGLGGRLDATNLSKSIVSVITPISLEHTAILGSTLRQIASEKAGIIKADSITVSSPQEEEALDVIKEVCQKKKNAFYLVERDISIDKKSFDRDRQSFAVEIRYRTF